MKEFIVEGIENLDSVADYIVEISSNHKVFFLNGDLGAGKTTLVKKVCEKLGSNDRIVSPTFALVNIYDSNFSEIYHIDLYRLDNIEEAIELGIEDYLYSNKYCFIEWASIIKPISPEIYFEINIEILDINKRKVVILEQQN